MTIYCDIDGTLTFDGTRKWGAPNQENIDAIRAAQENGHTVILWSATGEAYAKAFARKYRFRAHAYLGKPDVCFDDWKTIRPKTHMDILPPDSIIPWVETHGVPREAK